MILSSSPGVKAPLFRKIALSGGKRTHRHFGKGHWNHDDLASAVYESVTTTGDPIGWCSRAAISRFWGGDGIHCYLEWSYGAQSRKIARLLKQAQDLEIYLVTATPSDELQAAFEEYRGGTLFDVDDFLLGYLAAEASKPLLLDDVNREFAPCELFVDDVTLRVMK